MKNLRVLLIFVLSSLISQNIHPQTSDLRPGFDVNEFKQLLLVNFYANNDSIKDTIVPLPKDLYRIYRSQSMCFDNRWELWFDGDVAVIAIRGTAPTTRGWLSNAHSVMLPAKGAIQIKEDEYFNYELATNPMASVHAGWLYSTAFLSKDISLKIDSLHQNGVRNFIITGHSQGGVIATLLTAHYLQLQVNNKIPQDIIFKTYASAAPKPGNLYFAYDYESLTQSGWSFNVVNSLDWVPETPSTVQTFQDYNINNPFEDANELFKTQKWAKRIALKHVYKKVNKPMHKALKAQEKYLGKKLAGLLNISDMEKPNYRHESAYVRTGNTIVLKPTSDYHEKFESDSTHYFTHHLLKAYTYLINKYDQ
jgi:pimeloyl-ACP methyl ester carboxylesterase